VNRIFLQQVGFKKIYKWGVKMKYVAEPGIISIHTMWTWKLCFGILFTVSCFNFHLKVTHRNKNSYYINIWLLYSLVPCMH
jgi:hypothetical protein